MIDEMKILTKFTRGIISKFVSMAVKSVDMMWISR